MDEIRSIVDKFQPDVFFVSEAEITADNSSLIKIKGYSLELSGSVSLGKARLIAYLKPNLLQRKIALEGDSENIIVLENENTRVVGLYRGFKNYKGPMFDPLRYLLVFSMKLVRLQKTY